MKNIKLIILTLLTINIGHSQQIEWILEPVTSTKQYYANESMIIENSGKSILINRDTILTVDKPCGLSSRRQPCCGRQFSSTFWQGDTITFFNKDFLKENNWKAQLNELYNTRSAYIMSDTLDNLGALHRNDSTVILDFNLKKEILVIPGNQNSMNKNYFVNNPYEDSLIYTFTKDGSSVILNKGKNHDQNEKTYPHFLIYKEEQFSQSVTIAAFDGSVLATEMTKNITFNNDFLCVIGDNNNSKIFYQDSLVYTGNIESCVFTDPNGLIIQINNEFHYPNMNEGKFELLHSSEVIKDQISNYWNKNYGGRLFTPNSSHIYTQKGTLALEIPSFGPERILNTSERLFLRWISQFINEDNYELQTFNNNIKQVFLIGNTYSFHIATNSKDSMDIYTSDKYLIGRTYYNPSMESYYRTVYGQQLSESFISQLSYEECLMINPNGAWIRTNRKNDNEVLCNYKGEEIFSEENVTYKYNASINCFSYSNSKNQTYGLFNVVYEN